MHEESRIVGAAAHVLTVVYGWVVAEGAGPSSVETFISTGIAAPVARPKGRCPSTEILDQRDEIADLDVLTAENTADLTGMRSHGDVSASVIGEDVVEDVLGSNVLVDGGLSVQSGPVRVVLRETLFELVAGEAAVDRGLGAAPVAGVGADSLAEKLFDGGCEGVVTRKVELVESKPCGIQTSI